MSLFILAHILIHTSDKVTFFSAKMFKKVSHSPDHLAGSIWVHVEERLEIVTYANLST